MKKNLLLLGASLFTSLILAEIILRIFTPFPVETLRINVHTDPILGVKLNPELKEIDASGYRNPAVLKKADFVTLGDSHTFGTNVKSEYSWPQALARKANMSAYNYGIGGYGPLQYSHLFDRAVELKPKYIIVGLFLFNDLRDISKFLTKLPHWQKWARDNNIEFMPGLRNKAQKDQFYKTDLTLKILSILQNIALLSAVDHLFLGNQQLVGRKMHRLRELKHPESMRWENIYINDANLQTGINYFQIYNGADGTDLNNNDIALSFEIAKFIFKEMKRKADERQINFSVLLISSKFEILYDYLNEHNITISSRYHRLVGNLKELKKEFSEFFDDNKIQYFDSEPFIKNAIRQKKVVYKDSLDDHPLEAGYEAYAETVYQGLFNNLPDQ